MFDLGSIGAGIGQLVGGIYGAETSRRSASKQMEFQERMSSTAYQRATADMKAAGLNPMLAYQQGGASAPSGSSFSLDNIAEGAVSNALQVRKLKADLLESSSRRGLMSSQEWAALKQGELAEAQANLIEANTVSAKNKADVESMFPKAFGWVDAIMERLNPLGKLGVGAALGRAALKRAE